MANPDPTPNEKPNPNETPSPNNKPAESVTPQANETLSKITTDKPSIERDRIRYAFYLGIIGFSVVIILALVISVLTLKGFKDAQSVTTIISPFLTVLGTLVGAFFGLQIGAQGTDQANQQAQNANARADNVQNMATELAAIADPTEAQKIVKSFRNLPESK